MKLRGTFFAYAQDVGGFSDIAQQVGLLWIYAV